MPHRPRPAPIRIVRIFASRAFRFRTCRGETLVKCFRFGPRGRLQALSVCKTRNVERCAGLMAAAGFFNICLEAGLMRGMLEAHSVVVSWRRTGAALEGHSVVVLWELEPNARANNDVLNQLYLVIEIY